MRGQWRAVLVWGCGAVAGVCMGGRRAGAQGVKLGVVMDAPRAVLEQAWSEDPRQIERAYCVTHWSFGVYHVSRTIPRQDDTVFRVFKVEPASVVKAGPASAEFECPVGVPELHIHTPTTCAGDNLDTCVLGGLNAFSCQPSRGDLEKLTDRGDAFGVVQCDRRAFRFYFASEYLGRQNAADVDPRRPHARGKNAGADVRKAPM